MKVELHDIGKLIDWKALGLQNANNSGQPTEGEPHDFEKCLQWDPAIDFDSDAWQVIFRKDDIEAGNNRRGLQLRRDYWPDSLTYIWASIGDELASGWGRGAKEREFQQNPIFGRYCLWTGVQNQDTRLKTKEALDEMIRFINRSPSWEDAEHKYGDLWFQRAETARPGLNITSLHAHSVLAGKFAGIISLNSAKYFSPGLTWDEIKSQFPKLKITVAHFRIDFYQRPFRVSEWNIFAQRRAVLDGMSAEFIKNVIGYVGNQIIAIFPSKLDAMNFAVGICEKGFIIDYRLKETDYSDIKGHKGHLLEALKQDWQRYYKEPPAEEISLPICEVCQMSHAHYHWPADHLAKMSSVTDRSKQLLKETSWRDLDASNFPPQDQPFLSEWLDESSDEELCPACFHLRENSQRLRKLAQWKGFDVAWVYLSLDLDRLTSVLQCLQTEYIKTFFSDLPAKIEVTYPLIGDFIEDYKEALREFNNILLRQFDDAGIEQVDDDLWCIRLENRSKAIDIIDHFRDLMVSRFPKLTQTAHDVRSPISFSMSVSQHKYPFFVHLRCLKEATADVSIQVVNVGVANIPLRFLADVLQTLDHGRSTALHRLREIARTSRTLAELEMRNNKFDDLRDILQRKVDFQSLLILTNLMEDQDG